MDSNFRLSFLLAYILLNIINVVQTVPHGYLLGSTYIPGATSNSLCKIDPLTGKFSTLAALDDYKAYDVTYDFIHKVFYVFGSRAFVNRDTADLSVLVVNPFNGTQQYRPLPTEPFVDLFGLRVDSSTGKLYTLRMSDVEDDPVSIIQIDPVDFKVKRWVNITKSTGVQPNSMTIFYNATDHRYFVTVASESFDNALVGIDVVRRKEISRIVKHSLPAYLCYDNITNAFYGIQETEGKRGCRLIRLNPYNGTMEVLSHDFNDYLASTGTCYDGFYFTMIVKNLNTQKIVTFDLTNHGKIVASNPAESYLDAFAFVPI
ncbi:unnamed protein product [Adineta ricciae]|uniref:Uncharacterized protein n=1 Tax=Adineta ricciae TaxID=249248 RepID=A0A815IDQ8_ADIRI|nr:unnamed protein product [Adineta ricciae]CAF1364447.1 unnamed protein product [Adineta ricciae]